MKGGGVILSGSEESRICIITIMCVPSAYIVRIFAMNGFRTGVPPLLKFLPTLRFACRNFSVGRPTAGRSAQTSIAG